MKKLMTLLAMVAVMFAATANEPAAKEKAKTISLNNKEFIEKVFDYTQESEWKYKGDKPAIIDFWAAWCGPCKQIAPVLEEIAADYGEEIYVYKVNVDEETELAQAFGIRSIPTMLFVPVKGTSQAVMGAAPKAKLQDAVNTILLNKEDK